MKHPRYLNDLLDSSEIGDWLAYDRVEPFGMQAVERIGGHVGALLANCWMSGNPFEPFDMMPFTEAPPQTAEEGLSVIRDAKRGA